MINNMRWIVLRGLSREQQHWGTFKPLLQQALSGDDIYYLDLPGCGDQLGQSSPMNVTDIRKHLQQQCLAQNIAAPFNIIGLSLGGMVALDWASSDSKHVNAVVVINSSAKNCPFYHRLTITAASQAIAAMAAGLDRREQLFLKMVSHTHGNNRSVLKQWQAIQRQHPVKRADIVKQLVAAARFQLPAIPEGSEGLVLTSRNDGMVAHQCSIKIANYYHWPMAIHEQAGHDIPLDDPQWVIDKIIDWWGQTADC